MLLSIGMLMLSATQIYTILTVQLFAFLNLLPVEADILAYNFENGTQTFDDLPARFGYRLPTEGLKGFLINSKPENACEPIAPPPLKDNSTSVFIVLIRRLECNFDTKEKLCSNRKSIGCGSKLKQFYSHLECVFSLVITDLAPVYVGDLCAKGLVNRGWCFALNCIITKLLSQACI
uniref:Ring finger protein 13 n=1 Tax=Anser cygnoides TaxID=8845 RepID=A0A8B9IFD1_ANSCY